MVVPFLHPDPATSVASCRTQVEEAKASTEFRIRVWFGKSAKFFLKDRHFSPVIPEAQVRTIYVSKDTPAQLENKKKECRLQHTANPEQPETKKTTAEASKLSQ